MVKQCIVGRHNGQVFFSDEESRAWKADVVGVCGKSEGSLEKRHRGSVRRGLRFCSDALACLRGAGTTHILHGAILSAAFPSGSAARLTRARDFLAGRGCQGVRRVELGEGKVFVLEGVTPFHDLSAQREHLPGICHGIHPVCSQRGPDLIVLQGIILAAGKGFAEGPACRRQVLSGMFLRTNGAGWGLIPAAIFATWPGSTAGWLSAESPKNSVAKSAVSFQKIDEVVITQRARATLEISLTIGSWV